MTLTADLVCDAHASSCELFRVAFERPCHLAFECYGQHGDLRHLFASGYCTGLIVEGMVAGLGALLRGDLDKSVDFPLPQSDATAFFSRHFSREIDGVILTLESVPGHKAGLVNWIRISGPYGLDLKLRCTREATECFLGQLEAIFHNMPDNLEASSAEWAIAEAAKAMSQGSEAKLRSRALTYLVELASSSDPLLAADACEALGGSQGGLAARTLKNALSHPESVVRQCAAGSFGSSAGRRGAGQLKRLLAHEDPLTRLGAVRGIARALGEDAVPVLVRAQRKEQDDRVQAAIAGVLLAHGVEEGKLILAELLTSPCSSVRAFAKSELRKAGIHPGWSEP